MPAILFFGVMIVLWVIVMGVGFYYVFPVLSVAVLAATSLAALGFYYVQTGRTLAVRTAKGPSPVPLPDTAYLHYLVVQVWRDWWAIARTSVPRIGREAYRVLKLLTSWLTKGWWGLFLIPLWAGICAGIVAAAIPAAALGLLFTVLYGVVAAAGLAGWLVCVLVLAAVERVFMAFGRILQTCPHPFCYEKIALPVYECPSCGTRHERLVPNASGAFRHVCRCGTRLPTIIPLGRFRLTAYCPHCHGRLPERIGRVRVEPLPFVGGPAAGKTTFMFLAIRALHGRARALDGRVAFVEKRHAQAYAGAVREFQRGGRLAKTGPELPLATMVDVELPGAGHRILYLFDPAGEHFAGAGQVESLRYLDQGEALLFVVDPFALPQVRRTLTESERHLVDDSAASSDDDPADTLQRVLNELRSRPDQGRQKRVAVVITKTDLLVRTAIGRTLNGGPARPAEEVRSWLDRLGAGNVIRALDQVAGQVRYFASGLDTEPAEVAELLGWVTGLSVNGLPPEPSADADLEVPGTAPLRDPWPAHGRDSTMVPVGYQAGRWAILAGLSVLNVLALALTFAYALSYLT